MSQLQNPGWDKIQQCSKYGTEKYDLDRTGFLFPKQNKTQNEDEQFNEMDGGNVNIR